nr:palindromic element RPE3 domain-containing protein [Rickettsia canadensis]
MLQLNLDCFRQDEFKSKSAKAVQIVCEHRLNLKNFVCIKLFE